MTTYQSMLPQFVERFNELLEEKNISAKKLALDMGVSKNTAYEWIWNNRIMNTVNFMNLCKYLDVNPLWLYGISNERTSFMEVG
jgi:DNA-binding Xre family transcriptional regulator